MQVVAVLRGGFVIFYRDAMRVGIGVVTNPSQLPGNPRPRLAARYFEPVAIDFFGDVEPWLGRADRGEQIADVARFGRSPASPPPSWGRAASA
jgi:hypothetical protein